MPLSYSRNAEGQSVLAVECGDCHTTAALPSNMSCWNVGRDETVEETFRWHSGNSRYLNRCRSCERAHVARWRAARNVGAETVEYVPSLGINRTFGVEFECFLPQGGSRDELARQLRAAGLNVASTRGYGHDRDGWSIKSDGSLYCAGLVGIEVVSPILSGTDGLAQVRKTARILKSYGCKVNRSCGTHVHHGVSDLNLDEFKSVVRSYVQNQGQIDKFVTRSRRPGGSQYCRRVKPSELNRLMLATNVSQIGHYGPRRYKTINVQSFPRYGTVEIRQHQGTVDADKIVNWILFGQALIERAKVGEIAKQRTTDAFLAQLSSLPTVTVEFMKARAARLAEREAAVA